MHRDLTGAVALTLTTLLVATPALAQDADHGISVTDEGDEPRVELRYAWTEGLTCSRSTRPRASGSRWWSR